MFEPNKRPSSLRNSRVERIKRKISLYSTVPRDTQQDRPREVTVISALTFMLGSASLITALALLADILAHTTNTIIWLLGIGFVICVLLVAALLFLTALGQWRLRKWGLRLAIADSVVFLLWGVFAVVQVAVGDPLSLLTVQGLIALLAILVAVAILFFLSRPRVRASFR